MKESYVKKIGVGLHMPLNKFEIKLDNNIYIYIDGKEEKCFLQEIDQIEGYCISVCSDSNDLSEIITVEI